MLRILHALPSRLFVTPRFRRAFPIRSKRRGTPPPPGRGYSCCGVPNRVSHTVNIKTSQVPREPPCAHAPLFDHGGTFRLGHSSALRCCLALSGRRRLPQLSFRGSITRPAHFLSTLCNEGHPFATQDSVPVAGQLYRAGLSAGFHYKVSAVYRASPLSKLAWRTPTPRRSSRTVPWGYPNHHEMINTPLNNVSWFLRTT
jgi:hypothetical protein